MERFSAVEEPEEPQSKGGLSIDYKRVLVNALRYWYIIVTSLVTGLTIAYLINRYSTRIYPVTASIIIREYAENADAKFLYNNPLVNSYRNYYNEPYIMRSYPLITSVIEDLNFDVVIIRKGDIKSTEQYERLPFSITLLDKKKSSALQLTYLGDNKFECANTDGEHATVFSMTDTISCQGVRFRINITGDMDAIKGKEYSVQFRNAEEVAGSYISKLKVSWALPGSSVVNLDVNGATAQKEIDFLKKLIEYYQRYDLDKKNQAASRSLVFIDDQLKRTGDSLRIFENALETFKRQNFVTDLSAEARMAYDELKLVGQQRTAIIFADNYYSYLENYLKEGKAYDQVILPSTIGIADEVLNGLVSHLIDYQAQINGLANMNEKNDLVRDKSTVLAQAIAATKLSILEAVRNVRATDKIKVKGLDRQTAKLEQSLKNLPGVERKLVNIQRNFTLSENLYLFLQQKRAEAGISKASTTTDIMIVNPPRVAGGQISPKSMQNYLAFGGAGLFLPFLVLVILELLNTKVQSREDIDKITQVPFLGGIGHKSVESNLVVYEKPKSVLAESFRAIRSNLNYFTSGKEKKIFMITSSISGEGKTFTTINLATVFALSGKKTLIIGADLRKPKIFQDFNLTNEKGLSTYLSGLHKLDEVIQHTGVEHLDLISGGPVPPNPSELFLLDRMDEMMKTLIQQYEFILLDTAPLALITDGLVLSRYADHTLYLIRQNYTPKLFLKNVDELYRTGKLRNISLVLNDVHREGYGYGYGYGYAYGYGYGYGSGYYGANKKTNGSNYYSE